MKKELREIIAIEELTILSEKKTKAGETMSILAPWMVSDRKNKNGRLYPLSLIQREVAKFQERVKQGSVIGSADHPFGANTSLADASHIVTKLEVDKDGKGWAEMKILPTTKGKNVIEIIKAGGQLGISARGAGTISPSGIVASDYALLGIDIVTNPSEPEATFDKSNVFESQNFEDEKKEEENDREKVMYELLSASYGLALTQGFTGDIDLYCQLHEKGLREVMSLPANDKVPTQILADAEQQIEDRTHGYFLESQAGGYKGSYDEWKKKYPQLVEMASEEKVIVEKKEIKAPEKLKMIWDEVRAGGFRGTIDEWKEQYPGMELIVPASPKKVQKVVAEEILTEDELTKEAGRIFTKLFEENPNSQLTLEDVKKLLMKEQEEKVDIRIRRKAIQIVSRDVFNAGGGVDQRTLEKMVETEIENLKKERKLRRERNWQAYKRLLD